MKPIVRELKYHISGMLDDASVKAMVLILMLPFLLLARCVVDVYRGVRGLL